MESVYPVDRDREQIDDVRRWTVGGLPAAWRVAVAYPGEFSGFPETPPPPRP